MDFKLINRITAAIVFLISFLVLLSTVQPSVSFWDCGEFIAASYSLQVPHPPGAPLFLLIGRVFSMIPFAENVGFRVNMVSVLSSALSILFLYLIIVKVVENYRAKIAKNLFETLSTVIAAAIGALSFSFSDTFWFNGVEAEVYAASTVTYAAIMYLIMLWNERSEEPGNEKYLLLICYIIGLSTGIHLMSVLAMIPVVMIVLFKKYMKDEEEYDISVKYFLIHAAVILVVAAGLWLNQTSTTPPTPEQYKSFDGTFKILVFLISVGIMAGFYKKLLNRNSIYFSFIVGGIALGLTYPGVVKILPSIMSSIGGQSLAGELLFVAAFLGIFGGIVYYAHKNNKATLHLVGLAAIFVFLGFTTYTQVIIRSNAAPPMNENEPDTFPELVKYLNREQYGDFPTFKRRFSNEPHQTGVFTNYSSDLHFLYSYQMNHMMTRYLLWNYAGRESWDQDAGSNIAPFNGVGEIIGKPFSVEFKGDIKDSLFGIPFILGLVGVFLHFRRDKKMAMVYLVLFIFMGYLTAYYQNQQQPQPRERDYFYVGAFLVFSLWIGIGVKELATLVYNKLKENNLGMVLGYTVLVLGIFFVPVRMYSANLYTHDRSNNWIPWDYAYNLLQSCAPNSILFTNGDNDTFPLWYLQDVEGVRRDIRIVNLSLANTEWYIKQLKNQEPYGTPKVAMKFSDEEVERLRPTLYEAPQYTLEVPKDVFAKLSTGLVDSTSYQPKLVWNPDLPKTGEGQQTQTYARVQDFVVMQIIQNNNWDRPVYYSTTCSDDTKIGLQKFLYLEGMAFRLMPFEIPRGKDGVNEKVLWKQIMEEPKDYSPNYRPGFKFRGIADSSVFLDENHKRMTLNYRNAFLRLSNYYMIEKKDNATALKVLNMMEAKMPLSRTGLDYRYRADLANLYRRLGDMTTYTKMMEALEPEALAVLNSNPQILTMDVSTVTILLDYYETTKQADKALKLVDLLDRYYPNNPDVKAQRDKFNAILTGKAPGQDTVKKDSTVKK